MKTKVTTKMWGNSLGVILPADLVREEELKVGEEVVISVKKKSNVLRELFGALDFKKPTEELIKEIRKDMDSAWLD